MSQCSHRHAAAGHNYLLNRVDHRLRETWIRDAEDKVAKRSPLFVGLLYPVSRFAKELARKPDRRRHSHIPSPIDAAEYARSGSN